MSKPKEKNRSVWLLVAGLAVLLGINAVFIAWRSGALQPDNKVESIIRNMTLEEKVGQMIIPDFRTWNPDPSNPDSKAEAVTEMRPEIKEEILHGKFGGIILYAENCAENEATLKLVNEMQKVNQESGDHAVPLLTAIDQEGGSVARLGQGTRWPGAMAITATGDSALAEETGKRLGEELRALHINTDFAPVMDINNNPSNPVIGVRAFSDDPFVTSEYGLAFMKGLKDSGTIVSLKHFPGHGDVATDSHTGFPKLEKTYEQLKMNELIPYVEAIKNGADMIMTAHIQYPLIEKETYPSISTGENVFLPATLSPTFLTDILRNDMGFEGVVVTDGLNMAAITDHFAINDVAILGINAGVDMFLVPVPARDPKGVDALNSFIDCIVENTENGTIPESRINESVRRILKLKEAHGLLEYGSTELSEDDLKQAAEIPGCKANHDLEWQIVQKGATLLKNEGNLLPLHPKENETAVFFYSAPSRIASSDFARQRLLEEGILPESVKFEGVSCIDSNRGECLEKVRDADYVIAVNSAFDLPGLDPGTEEGLDSKLMDEVIEAAHAAGKKVILLSSQLPYDAARFPDADAIVLSYGSAPMKELPGPKDSYSANVPAVICGIFGEYEFSGKLPVSIPGMDSTWHFTDEILFEREIQSKAD